MFSLLIGGLLSEHAWCVSDAVKFTTDVTEPADWPPDALLSLTFLMSSFMTSAVPTSRSPAQVRLNTHTFMCHFKGIYTEQIINLQ